MVESMAHFALSCVRIKNWNKNMIIGTLLFTMADVSKTVHLVRVLNCYPYFSQKKLSAGCYIILFFCGNFAILAVILNLVNCCRLC